MHPLDVVFWVLFASVVAYVAWSFIRMFFEMLSERRQMREIKRPARAGNAGVSLGGAAGGVQSIGDTGTPLSGSDYGHSTSQGEAGSGESSGGDSGGGDFSGGGGEYGGGGSSGGW